MAALPPCFQQSWSAALNRHLIRFPSSGTVQHQPSDIRQAFEAALPLGMSNITFSFATGEHLAYFLSVLDVTQRRQLRHIFLRGTPTGYFLRAPDDFSSFTTLHFDTYILDRFPGLQLDTLTVQDAFHGAPVVEDGWGHSTPYRIVDALVHSGQGWRELRHLTTSDAMFVWTHYPRHLTAREAQPAAWDCAIRQRDGPASGAGAALWRSIDDPDAASDGEPGEELPQDRAEQAQWLGWRYVHEERPWADAQFEEFCQPEEAGAAAGVAQDVGDDAAGSSEEEEAVSEASKKQYLIVVKRGRDADIVVPEGHSTEKWRAPELLQLLGRYGWDWYRMAAEDVLLPGHDDPTAML